MIKELKIKNQTISLHDILELNKVLIDIQEGYYQEEEYDTCFYRKTEIKQSYTIRCIRFDIDAYVIDRESGGFKFCQGPSITISDYYSLDGTMDTETLTREVSYLFENEKEMKSQLGEEYLEFFLDIFKVN